jgi:hypothetical protein
MFEITYAITFQTSYWNDTNTAPINQNLNALKVIRIEKFHHCRIKMNGKLLYIFLAIF